MERHPVLVLFVLFVLFILLLIVVVTAIMRALVLLFIFVVVIFGRKLGRSPSLFKAHRFDLVFTQEPH